MTDKHLSTQFDSELCTRSPARDGAGRPGGITRCAPPSARCPSSAWRRRAGEFIENRVNQMEVEIDHELVTIIARRQPRRATCAC